MGIARLFTQTVSVATFLGTDSLGPRRADPVTKSVFINDARKMVRNRDGVEVVSETTLYGYLADIDAFTVNSDVLVNGRTAQVICAYRRDSAGPASAHHVEVTLT